MSDESPSASEEMSLRIEALIEKRNYHLAREKEAIAEAAAHQAHADRCNAIALDYRRVLGLARGLDNFPEILTELVRRQAREREVGDLVTQLPDARGIAEAMGSAINEAASKANRKRK